jgi:hypothetical protein
VKTHRHTPGQMVRKLREGDRLVVSVNSIWPHRDAADSGGRRNASE